MAVYTSSLVLGKVMAWTWVGPGSNNGPTTPWTAFKPAEVNCCLNLVY